MVATQSVDVYLTIFLLFFSLSLSLSAAPKVRRKLFAVEKSNFSYFSLAFGYTTQHTHTHTGIIWCLHSKMVRASTHVLIVAVVAIRSFKRLFFSPLQSYANVGIPFLFILFRHFCDLIQIFGKQHCCAEKKSFVYCMHCNGIYFAILCDVPQNLKSHTSAQSTHTHTRTHAIIEKY